MALKQGAEPAIETAVVAPVEADQGPRLPGIWYWTWVVWLNFSSWSMRKGKPLCPTVAPAPPLCGGKKRAATDDMTTKAVKLWKFGTSARSAKPGIFELCQSMGKVMGVLPRTLKSKALWVYFQM